MIQFNCTNHAAHLLYVLLILLHGRTAIGQDIDRADFRNKLAEVRINMTHDEVREILGKPDEIWTQERPGGIGDRSLKEVWCYGVSEHLSFPTLGRVVFGINGKVRSTVGARGKPPTPTVVDEATLRQILPIIDRIPAIELHETEKIYNPRDMIQVVNALHPLGRERAFAVLDEYARLSGDARTGTPENLALIVLTLFEVNEAVPMPGLIGEPLRQHFPRYPIVIRDDVPFFLFPLGGYFRSGPPMAIKPTLDHLRQHGVVRANALAPPARPMMILGSFASSPDWVFAGAGEEPSQSSAARDLIMDQLLWLVDTVYAVDVDASGRKISRKRDETQWNAQVAAMNQLDIRWDASAQAYTFIDGSSLTPPQNRWRRAVWDLSEPKRTITLAIERRTQSEVNVCLVFAVEGDAGIPDSAVIEVFLVEAPATVLCTFPYPGTLRSGRGGAHSQIIELARQTRIQARVVVDGKPVQVSPIYEP